MGHHSSYRDEIEAAAVWANARSEPLESVALQYNLHSATSYVRFDMPGDLHISAGFDGCWATLSALERRAALYAAVTGKDNEFWRAHAVDGFSRLYERASNGPPL